MEVTEVQKAIAKVQAGVGLIPKNGHMNFGNTNYDYVKNDDILEAISALLIENDVIVRPKLLAMQTESRELGANRVLPMVVVQLEQTYISTKDGSEYTIQVFGEGSGGDDKGLRKAVTQAQKIANLLTFSIATGEPDPDGIPTPSTEAPASASAAPRKTPPATKVQGAAGEAAVDKLRANVKTTANAKGVSVAELNKRGQEIHANYFNIPAALDQLLKVLNDLPDKE